MRINIDIPDKLHKSFKNLSRRYNVSMSAMIEDDIIDRINEDCGIVTNK